MTHEKKTLSIRSDNYRSQILPKPQRTFSSWQKSVQIVLLIFRTKVGGHINAAKFKSKKSPLLLLSFLLKTMTHFPWAPTASLVWRIPTGCFFEWPQFSKSEWHTLAKKVQVALFVSLPSYTLCLRLDELFFFLPRKLMSLISLSFNIPISCWLFFFFFFYLVLKGYASF